MSKEEIAARESILLQTSEKMESGKPSAVEVIEAKTMDPCVVFQ